MSKAIQDLLREPAVELTPDMGLGSREQNMRNSPTARKALHRKAALALSAELGSADSRPEAAPIDVTGLTPMAPPALPCLVEATNL